MKFYENYVDIVELKSMNIFFFKDLSSRNEKNKTLYSELDIKSRPWTKCKHKIAGYASVIYIYLREREMIFASG